MADASKNNKKTKDNFFSGFAFFVLPVNFGNLRLKIFKENIKKYNGNVLNSIDECEGFEKVYIIVEKNVEQNKLKHLVDISKIASAYQFAKCTWISKCIKAKVVLELGDEIINFTLGKKKLKSLNHNGKKVFETINNNEVDILNNVLLDKCGTSTLDKKKLNNVVDSKISNVFQEGPSSSFQKKFVCAFSSNTVAENMNKPITDELQKLASVYKAKNDAWRAVGYEKAITAIKKYPEEIKDWQTAKSIKGVGERLADKIVEIIDSGKLRKVSEVCEGEEAMALKLFMGVWGAGASTAQSWYAQGYRSLDDLQTKASLSKNQQVGLRFYDDFNDRIPRHEATQIEEFVKSCALNLQPGLTLITCGSYRRGHPTCGDVDILITHPDGHSHKNIFKTLLNDLRSKKFVTDDLVIQQNHNQQKYLGVCQLPIDKAKHRRLDIIVVPYSELAPALLYFTGSAHFNRSMRLLAKKMGMSLSEHGLKKEIIRVRGEKVNEGRYLDSPSEESIFQHLGLMYRPPNERDH